MKLHDKVLTNGLDISTLMVHVEEDTQIHICTSAAGSGVSVHLGALTIFMERDDAHLFADAIQDYLDRTESDAADAIY